MLRTCLTVLPLQNVQPQSIRDNLGPWQVISQVADICTDSTSRFHCT